VFSQEAAGGGMEEANVDVRECDFANLDLSDKVWSGVLLRGTKLNNAKLVGVQMARADAQDAVMDGADLTDANCYATAFDGASLRGAQFENAILTSASFGKSAVTGKWADLAGAHFEGALLSSSDVGRICENPTLDPETRQYEVRRWRWLMVGQGGGVVKPKKTGSLSVLAPALPVNVEKNSQVPTTASLTPLPLNHYHVSKAWLPHPQVKKWKHFLHSIVCMMGMSAPLWAK
jgi:hypothetical protein